MPYTGNQNFSGSNFMNQGFANPNLMNPNLTSPGMAASTPTTTSSTSNSFGLSDRDLFDLLLSQHKLLAESMTQTILESANPQLRQDCISILNRDFMHQRVIWEAMNQRGWYNTNPGFNQNMGLNPQQTSMNQFSV